MVPSDWYENSPLIILEALITRTPLLVSDLGGMAELVVHGEHGYRFRVGDPEDLAARLADLIREPERMQSFYTDPRPVRGVAEDAEQLLALYGEALAQRRARSTGRAEGAP